MSKFCFCLLVVLSAFMQSQMLSAQSSDSVKTSHNVLVLPLDSSQFYSDMMPVSLLSYIYSVPEEGVSGPAVMSSRTFLKYLDYKDFQFIYPDEQTIKEIRSRNVYRTLGSDSENGYLAMVPISRDQSSLREAMRKNGCDYFLTINLYEILRTETPYEFEQKVVHVIHYELFSKDFQLLKAGRYEGIDILTDPRQMAWIWEDLSKDLAFWIEGYEKGMGDPADNYLEAKDNYFKSLYGIAGKQMVGLHAGLGMPMGGIGAEYTYFITEYFGLGGGIGWDYSGFKVGAGARLPLRDYNKQTRPVLSLYYSYASGAVFNLGEEYDTFGNLVDFSKYKIYSDHAVHIRFGMAIVIENGEGIVMPSIGYAFPFRDRDSELLEGDGSILHDGFVRFSEPGGLEFGIMFFFSLKSN